MKPVIIIGIRLNVLGKDEENFKYKKYDYERNHELVAKKRPRSADVLNSNVS